MRKYELQRGVGDVRDRDGVKCFRFRRIGTVAVTARVGVVLFPEWRPGAKVVMSTTSTKEMK